MAEPTATSYSGMTVAEIVAQIVRLKLLWQHLAVEPPHLLLKVYQGLLIFLSNYMVLDTNKVKRKRENEKEENCTRCSCYP